MTWQPEHDPRPPFDPSCARVCPVHPPPTGKEVAETLKVVDHETREAEAKKTVVLGEEAIANEKAGVAKAIKVGRGPGCGAGSATRQRSWVWRW